MVSTRHASPTVQFRHCRTEHIYLPAAIQRTATHRTSDGLIGETRRNAGTRLGPADVEVVCIIAAMDIMSPTHEQDRQLTKPITRAISRNHAHKPTLPSRQTAQTQFSSTYIGNRADSRAHIRTLVNERL